MKFFSARYFALFMLACSLSNVITASRYAYEESDACCRSSCYECSCNPLYCGAFDVQIHAGVAPIVWRDRGEFSFIRCVPSPATNPLVTLFEGPRFKHLFRTPWIVGGQLGYHVSDNVRVYLEFNYLQSRGKHDAVIDADNESVFTFDLPKYRLFDAYVGARYYFDRWCDRVSFFLGFKAGLVHHRNVRSNFRIDDELVVPAPFSLVGCDRVEGPAGDLNFIRRRTSPSGGLNFGLDICFCGNWSFVITGEVVASCAPHLIDSIPLDRELFDANILLLGHVGTELRFPITAGIRYTF